MSEMRDSAREARPVILVVEEDESILEALSLALGDSYEVLEAACSARAFAILEARHVDLILLDVRPRRDRHTILDRLRSLHDEVGVILLTGAVDVRADVKAIQFGAFEHLTTPFEEEVVRAIVARVLKQRALSREVSLLRAELASRADDELIGESPAMKQLRDAIARVAPASFPVLILGEKGTGKEVVARVIHRSSPRRQAPFIAVRMNTPSQTLMESELFGHEPGAYVGAFRRKLGGFELAQSGTLLLDEIATLSRELQVTLLRVLEAGAFERIGGIQRINSHVRIIATTNVDLRAAVAAGHFREDLYDRLTVATLRVPALRERLPDVGLLAEHFVARFGRNRTKDVRGITPAAVMAAHAYRWPGNVRELHNVMERCVALAEGPLIDVHDLPLELFASPPSDAEAAEPLWLREACRQFERQFVLRILEACRGNQQKAARRLGVRRNSLVTRLSRWGMTRGGPADRVQG